MSDDELDRMRTIAREGSLWSQAEVDANWQRIADALRLQSAVEWCVANRWHANYSVEYGDWRITKAASGDMLPCHTAATLPEAVAAAVAGAK